jgi:hypothetical protein
VSKLASLLVLLVEVILLVLRHRYDPDRLKQELNRRIDDAWTKDRQEFRRALDRRDEDSVSRRLADRLERLRRSRGLPDRLGEDDPPEER